MKKRGRQARASNWQGVKKFIAGQYKNRGLLFMLLVPLLVYAVFFCFYTWPWVTHFRGWFFTDSGDGLQNVWNMWWIHKSVTELHQLPWHTMYLHAPYGVTLLGQTLNPFNGFVALALLKFMTLNQAFNTMVVFSFLFGGLTTFWLCHYFTKRYVPSLIGGFIFTFSSYHFAHAIGHMQLVSLEFMPLFLLLWWKLLKKPTYWLAAGASVSLLLVVLCDYYYFLYSVFTAAAIAVYLWRKKELANIKKRQNYFPLGFFAGLSALIVAPIPAALFLYNSRDVLTGSHPARLLSTDLFTPFLDGGFWRFRSLTNFYWHLIPAYIAESSIYISVAVLAVVGIGAFRYFKRRKVHSDLGFWLWVAFIFGLFSLGPRLKVFGYSINHIPMPYVILEKIIPGLKLSGVPVRMMVMVTLASSIITAMVLSSVKWTTRKTKVLGAAFLLLLFIELWPSQLPFTPITQPQYVKALHSLPATGAVLDDGATSASFQLYHQIEFDKPMILGYISRTPQSVVDKDEKLITYIRPGRYGQLCSLYKLRYITTPASRPIPDNFPAVYSDGQVIIYDLKNSPNC